jgi:hypothetical protein
MQAPIKLEEPDVRKARRLPMPGPGIVVNIPLHLLPAYFKLYGLEPIEGHLRPPVWKLPVVMVKRTRRNDGKKEANSS